MAFGTPTATTASLAAAATSLAITLPASIAAGDLLLLFTSEQTQSVNITWPTGFVNWPAADSNRINFGCRTAYKVADGTEGGTSVTINYGNSKVRTAVAVRVVGAAGRLPYGVTLNNGATSTSIPCLDLAYPGKGGLALLIAAQQAAAAVTFTAPSGYTQAISGSPASTGSAAIGVSYLTALDSGTALSTGSNTVTSSLSNNWVSMTLTFGDAAPIPTTRRRLFRLPFRARRTGQVVATAAATVTTQALPPQSGRHALRPTISRRSRAATPVPTAVATTTTQALPPQSSRRSLRPPLLRRFRATAPVGTASTAAPAQGGRHALRPQPSRRSRVATPVPATVVTPTTQALPPQPATGRRAWFPKRHSVTATPVQPGAVIVTTQSLPPQGGRAALRPQSRRRAKVATPVPTATQSPPPQGVRRLLRPTILRRTEVAVPVPLGAPTPPMQPRGRHAAPSWRRRAYVAQPVSAAVVAVPNPIPPQPTRRVRLLHRFTKRGRSTQFVNTTAAAPVVPSAGNMEAGTAAQSTMTGNPVNGAQMWGNE